MAEPDELREQLKRAVDALPSDASEADVLAVEDVLRQTYALLVGVADMQPHAWHERIEDAIADHSAPASPEGTPEP